MELQSKLIGGCVGALILLASPSVQAMPGYAGAQIANATNSSIQSAVRAARDDASRKAAYQQTVKSEVKARQ
ncbi:MAG: hypothetical protein NTV56_15305 [Alphaproteobacteria bacterium]|nr:hypothetical protein [Alphaproteobacteria bacterium]